MSPIGSTRLKRWRDGTYRLRLPDEERALLQSLPDQLRQLLRDPASDGDPSLRRLFPPAYGDDDAQRSAEFAGLVRDDLLQQRLAALDVLEAAASSDRLDEDRLVACLGALNDLRLVLGTRLGVTEGLDRASIGPDDPDFGSYVVYDYLTGLQGLFLEALTGDDTW